MMLRHQLQTLFLYTHTHTQEDRALNVFTNHKYTVLQVTLLSMDSSQGQHTHKSNGSVFPKEISEIRVFFFFCYLTPMHTYTQRRTARTLKVFTNHNYTVLQVTLLSMDCSQGQHAYKSNGSVFPTEIS